MPTRLPAKPAAKSAAAKKAPARRSAKTAAAAVDEQLARYRSIRDFNLTAEPSGSTTTLRGAAPKAHSSAKHPKAQDGAKHHPFCIQKHAASHLHYDFRLGWNGVLKSWACAKGPSYNPRDKRLAIQVEDHPIEYGGFEGVIPAGQYGGGTVMLWDQGSWQPQPGHEDVDEGLARGELKFTLDGTRMHGKWALIRMKARPRETKPAWLLIKEHDDFERTAPSVTDSEPDSVITGRTLDQIAASHDHTWNSNKSNSSVPHSSTASPSMSGNSQPPVPHSSTAPPSINGKHHLDLSPLPSELQPTFIKPQLATETLTPPSGPGWLHELKLDGYRIQVRKAGPRVQLFTRNGLDWTHRMPALARDLARLPCRDATLDGEVVVLAEDGTTSFADLQAAFQEDGPAAPHHPLTFFAFDLLHLDGHSTRDLSLLERKLSLAQLIHAEHHDNVQFSEHLDTGGDALFQKACKLHAEGILSKRASAPYTSKRDSNWLKAKCLHEQEFVIGGYTLPSKGGPGLGALLLGYYEDKRLIYAGRTGTGFTQKFAATLRKRLETAEIADSPFHAPTPEARKNAIWVRPSTVAQVRFAAWTADNQLRQAAFLGIREDKPASDVRREIPNPAPKSSQNRQLGASLQPVSLEKSPVRLTHPDKLLDPESGLTKQQLADFYWTVAPHMLPYVAGRPLSLVRLPSGIGHDHFFQKHVTPALPQDFDSIDVTDKKTGAVEPYIALHTPEAIASLAQISVFEIHPWGSTAQHLEQPDRLILDLDPDESLPWSAVTAAALKLRNLLQSFHLESFVKTTGGKGLHVVIPVEPELAFPQALQFCHGLVQHIERAEPHRYLTRMTKSARTGKIYLDYLRNERGATAIAPFSPRARSGVGVAVPLAWEELDAPARPDFRIANFSGWSGRLRDDRWAEMPKLHQHISAEARKACGVR